MSIASRLAIGLVTVYVLFLFIFHMFISRDSVLALGINEAFADGFKAHSIYVLAGFTFIGTALALRFGSRYLGWRALGYALAAGAVFAVMVTAARHVVGYPVEIGLFSLVLTVIGFNFVFCIMLMLMTGERKEEG